MTSIHTESLVYVFMYVSFRDATPTYDADNPDKMIYVLFDRTSLEDDILFFVRPNTTKLVGRKTVVFYRCVTL